MKQTLDISPTLYYKPTLPRYGTVVTVVDIMMRRRRGSCDDYSRTKCRNSRVRLTAVNRPTVIYEGGLVKGQSR
jgi:hypothetical protein